MMPKPYAINLPESPRFDFLSQDWVVDLADKINGMLNCYVRKCGNCIRFNKFEFDKDKVTLSKIQNLTK